jgi:outer membrane immunogenic protein
MLKFASLTTAALALTVSGALADGMSFKDAPPAFGWSGMYIGGTIGYGWGSSTHYWNNCSKDRTCAYGSVDDDHPATSNDPDGALIGVTVGYNHPVSDRWIGGVEGDISMADITGNDGYYWGDGHRWYTGMSALLTLRARVGYQFEDRTLLYGTAGVAAVDSDEYNIGDETGNDDQGANNTGWRWGYVVGLGVERAFTDRLSGKIEYLHVGLADNDGNGIKNNGHSVYKYENDLDVIRVGLNYKVN